MRTSPLIVSPQLAWYRRKSDGFKAQGLTSNGKRYKRNPNARNLTVRLEMRRLRGLQAWNLRVSRLRKIGLTTRGKKRIYAVRRGDAIILKSQIESLARSISKVFPAMPNEIKSQIIELESALAGISKQII